MCCSCVAVVLQCVMQCAVVCCRVLARDMWCSVVVCCSEYSCCRVLQCVLQCVVTCCSVWVCAIPLLAHSDHALFRVHYRHAHTQKHTYAHTHTHTHTHMNDARRKTAKAKNMFCQIPRNFLFWTTPLESSKKVWRSGSGRVELPKKENFSV